MLNRTPTSTGEAYRKAIGTGTTELEEDIGSVLLLSHDNQARGTQRTHPVTAGGANRQTDSAAMIKSHQ